MAPAIDAPAWHRALTAAGLEVVKLDARAQPVYKNGPTIRGRLPLIIRDVGLHLVLRAVCSRAREGGDLPAPPRADSS